ncbi:hypothetical protein LCGC14_0924380 [marine sediment metagenome]|uniref:Uncharacterized protein n=1 Tax=marine sediment metagenome TaxID=412755 RepID=A0A0F9R8I5_9ZZZZ
MAEFIHLQSDFSLGQLNEKLHSSVDSEIYLSGVRKATNVVVTPERGLLKRFGLKLGIALSSIEGNITADNTKYVVLETSPIEKLIIIFSPQAINILEAGPDGLLILKQFIGSPFVPYTGEQVKELTFAQSRGVLLVFHEDVTPMRLAILPFALDFSFTIAPIKNVPVFGFDEESINTFTFRVSNQGGIRRNSTLTVLTGSTTLLTDAFIGGLFVAEGGIMRMTNSPTGSTINGDVVVKFTLGSTDIPGTQAFISQQAMNSTRGWPKGGVFFDSRLWLIGLKALPNAIFGSAVEDFFNFATTTENAGDAIDDILQAKSLTFVKGGVADKTLIVFTNDGPFATQLPIEGALTPSNTAFGLQGAQTISDIPALTLDNKVIFMDAGGKVLWGMSYSDEKRGYSIVNLSITGSDVLNEPIASIIFKGGLNTNTSYALIVNKDGTMAVFTSDEEARVNGWTEIITDGKFKDILGLGDFAYVVVERGNQLFLERIDFTSFMDAAVEQVFTPAQTTIPNLSHLEGKTVEVIADGLLLPIDLTTDPGLAGSSIVRGGQLKLKKAATRVEVGLPFTLEIIPMPINVRTEMGDNLNLPKTIKYARVSFFESLGIQINGVLLKGQEFSPTNFTNVAEPITGSEKVKVSKGYEPTDIHISVTQDRPLPCYIRAIDIQVDM